MNFNIKRNILLITIINIIGLLSLSVYGKAQVKDMKGAAKYIGRYAARPAIAESRIVSYDGKKVVIKYERHEDGKLVQLELDVMEFIGRLLRHLPDKNFSNYSVTLFTCSL